jgi:hypothetical protein
MHLHLPLSTLRPFSSYRYIKWLQLDRDISQFIIHKTNTPLILVPASRWITRSSLSCDIGSGWKRTTAGEVTLAWSRDVAAARRRQNTWTHFYADSACGVFHGVEISHPDMMSIDSIVLREIPSSQTHLTVRHSERYCMAPTKTWSVWKSVRPPWSLRRPSDRARCDPRFDQHRTKHSCLCNAATSRIVVSHCDIEALGQVRLAQAEKAHSVKCSIYRMSRPLFIR